MSRSIALIAPSPVPFQIGGAEKFWWGLYQALAARPGILAEIIKLPSPEATFGQIVQSYRQFAELDLAHFDMVISTKYPAWMIRHPNHVLYMQHTLRGLYDTYHFTGLPETVGEVPARLESLLALARKPHPDRADLATMFELCDRALADKNLPPRLFAFPGPLIRELVHFFDRVALAPGQISAYLAISQTVRQRPEYFPQGRDVLVLHHPSDIERYLNDTGSYIFTASRINSTKRVELLVRAMAHVRANVPLKIAGTGPELENLKKLAAADPRIEFLGHVPDSDLPKLYAGAIFVPFVPYQEDYGLITIEAMNSGKPVLTATDCGGVCEFVQNGITGLCVEPNPAAIGQGMQKLLDNPELVAKMGQLAKDRVASIRWPQVVEALLLHAAGERARGSGDKVIVCSTFAADRFGSGGQRRLYHYCRALAARFSVCLICGGDGAMAESEELAPNFWQLAIPRPRPLLEEIERLKNATGASMDDVAIMLASSAWPAYLDMLASQRAGAGLVVASHPYLQPMISQVCGDLPLIYDAHNVEYDLKRSIHGIDGSLVGSVRRVEEECCRAACAITCCSAGDAARLASLYNVPQDICHVLPNGFDSDEITFADSRKRQRLRQQLPFAAARLALFTGSGHGPNVEAAREIIAMAPKLPDIQFILAGSVCNPLKYDNLPPNTHLAGIVSEKAKNILLMAADIGLNPVTTGSGTNLKIIEYLASGLECLSTPFGMRGMAGEYAPLAHVCELPDFPAAMRKIIANPIAANVADGIASRVADTCSWQACLRDLPEIVARCLQKRGDKTQNAAI